MFVEIAENFVVFIRGADDEKDKCEYFKKKTLKIRK